MNQRDLLSQQEIRKSLNFIYSHLGNILGEAGIIMAEINKMKDKLKDKLKDEKLNYSHSYLKPEQS